ncbi:MAG: hypothetical protein PHY12_14180, partial [Eubacteriales bacterium]|nr:hypothetical protein [Eubacteriales bacterium]
ELAPPSRAFDDAIFYHTEHPAVPLSYCMAATCDGGDPLLVMLRAEDGQMFVQRADKDDEPVYCKLTIDRLLPKMQFVYDF